MKPTILQTLRVLSLKKSYVIYSLGYGISTLVVPLAVQFLVNKLALAGIWINTISFLIIITAGLVLSQVLRFCQVVINEYLQRELFTLEARKWQKVVEPKTAVYFFETVNVIKAFSLSFTNFVEILLIAFFGMLVVASFHPIFLLLILLIIGGVYFVFMNFPIAVRTSIAESDRKYELHSLLLHQQTITDAYIEHYLVARHEHFRFIKRNTLIVSAIVILGQLFLLGSGLYLVRTEELSIGQLVSAEIILSGILVSLTKLPKTLESIYDFETGQYKLKHALEKTHD